MREFDQRPTAYSYIRMSSKRQIKGDSLRRQLELSKKSAEDHNLRLDESSMVADKGVSAWTGANLTEGEFGQFLAAAKAGHIKPGSYLLVESLDRLSRQQVRTALLPFMELINADITIVTLADNQVYSKATVDANFTQLIISLTIMARAHEESETKSKRLRAVAKNRRENAANGVGRFSPMHVGWIDSERVGNDRWTFNLNGHANAVRRIFALADSGLGQVTITKRLNDEGVPTFRGKGLWFPANVGRIMRDETVVGTYQPTHVVEDVRQPFGQPIKDYYPAVVSEELFWRVQRGIKVGFAKDEFPFGEAVLRCVFALGFAFSDVKTALNPFGHSPVHGLHFFPEHRFQVALVRAENRNLNLIMRDERPPRKDGHREGLAETSSASKRNSFVVLKCSDKLNLLWRKVGLENLFHKQDRVFSPSNNCCL
ncbi:recombinase family protein [Agrobacterium tumefaciens]|uniref:recombinase family protein n=1 Tax=Agrobacterium tumefaciens TaxID=358 RepID=UPI000DD0637E|nr:recombinase family protein [Agrobacterium tumefaciens]UXT83591.1 recombinase family protein [Agrobacterium tumefaciens]